jgi:succinyl-diaminopimelate desuccinylase
MRLSGLERGVINHIDDDELIGWVQELTRIPSVWQPERAMGEEAAARWVAGRCRQIGLQTFVEMVEPGRPNVIALLEPAPDGPTLMFEGHTDVVTPGDPARWRDPPFSATIRDGRIYGRGVNDMKAGLVCALIAAKALKQSGVKLAGNLLIGAVCDEEGDMIGIKHFVERGWADRVSAAIICEPEENHLCLSQKGVMWLRVTIQGVMCHGAMPLTGINTAYPMARFLTMVQSLEEREIVQHRAHPTLGQPSITPTILVSPVAGEPQKNVMPAATETVLDFRLVPGQNPEALLNQVETMLEAVTTIDAGLSYTLAVIEIRPPTETKPDEPVVTSLASAYEDLTGQAPIYGGVPGSTDGTILHAWENIPIVTCGPGDIHIPHHIDEWVSIAEIKLAARLYAIAALRYLGVREG